MNKYIAIYVRRSVSDKEKGNNSLSIPAQIADCIKFVGEDAFYKVYEEDGKSGKDIKHRPAFRQMFEDCREGLVSKIVVKKYDRFSRNMREEQRRRAEEQRRREAHQREMRNRSRSGYCR